MDYVKFGIIGIGNMGSSHVKYIGELANAKLTAVCDINPKAFERIAPETREKIKCFTDADTFFKEADIDAVLIAVPHYDHPDLAIRDGAMWGMWATWSGEFVRKTTGMTAKLSEQYTEEYMMKKAYEHEAVITLDEMPDLKAYPISESFNK